MTTKRKKLGLFLGLGGLILTAASASAQSASTANTAAMKAGSDVAAAHSDQATVGTQSGNPTASGAIADGARVGDNKAITSTNATASTQSASVGNTTAVKAGSDVAVAHSDHASVGINDGNINADVRITDGVRVGNNKLIADQGGRVSVPVIEAVIPGASVAKSIAKKVFPHW
jgi:hypothetical protein